MSRVRRILVAQPSTGDDVGRREMSARREMMTGEETRVQVEIHGGTYTLRGSESPETVRELAALVDGRMAEIAARTNTVDTARVAILAALNLAEELHSLRRDPPPPGKTTQADVTRDQDLCQLLDAILAG
ncbi:MAG: cell division protein ZapA [Acidobacteriota bacterium]